jgi:excisionase family DNA binding protein
VSGRANPPTSPNAPTNLDGALRAMIAEVVREEFAVLLAQLQPTPAPNLVTVDEYARRRSISVSTVRAAIREGRLPIERIGRAVRVPADASIARPVNNAEVARDSRRARLLGGR